MVSKGLEINFCRYDPTNQKVGVSFILLVENLKSHGSITFILKSLETEKENIFTLGVNTVLLHV